MSTDIEQQPSVRSHGHSYEGNGHGHSHGLIDRSITRSRDGLKTVGLSLAVLLITSIVQGGGARAVARGSRATRWRRPTVSAPVRDELGALGRTLDLLHGKRLGWGWRRTIGLQMC
jgi:hypothetical protein